MKYLKSENRWSLTPDAQLDVRDALPNGNYTVCQNPLTKEYFLEESEPFTLPQKLYGRDDERANDAAAGRRGVGDLERREVTEGDLEGDAAGHGSPWGGWGAGGIGSTRARQDLERFCAEITFFIIIPY